MRGPDSANRRVNGLVHSRLHHPGGKLGKPVLPRAQEAGSWGAPGGRSPLPFWRYKIRKPFIAECHD